MWRYEVEQGMEIYANSGRRDLVPTDVEATVAWFESRAPVDYEFDRQESKAIGESGERFERVNIQRPSPGGFAKIAHIRTFDSDNFLLSELFTGNLCQATIDGESLQRKTIAKVADPVHSEPTDLDGDGEVDFVVADIGRMNPTTQRYGTLWWIHRQKDRDPDPKSKSDPFIENGWQTVALRTGFSRVCDARPIDYDLDGDQDLIVAEFGFLFEGSIHLMTNMGMENGVPKFESRVVDKRNGAIHVPVHDLNMDGKPDFLTLVSQEHESIEAQINLGDGRFERRVIYTAADPAYASSGIEVVDIDGDGDLDVLYTNGDTFDDHIAKPFHSIQWLENDGTYPFTHHHLASMPGAYRAVAGDIDLDGDLDIAAVSLISQADSVGGFESHEYPNVSDDREFDGVIWLEQKDQKAFVRHQVVANESVWASCELIDVDQDQDLDLLLGRYIKDGESTDSLVLYRNRTNP